MNTAATDKYPGLIMLLHWTIAVLVIAQWLISIAAEGAPSREAGSAIMANHFSLGVVIFVLVAFRLVWRLANPIPPQMRSHQSWERTLARLNHWTFYALLLAMPIAGWVAMSSFGEPISVFGLVSLPPLPVGVDPARGEAIFELHGASGIALLVLAAIHTLAALKHQFIDKDGTLYRMLPFGAARD